MKLNLNHSLIKENEFIAKIIKRKLKDINFLLRSADQSAGLAWVDWPLCYDKKEFLNIQKTCKTHK